jgi:hypothetical protein
MFGGVYDSWKGLVAANCRVDCFVDLIITMLYSHGFVDSIRKKISGILLATLGADLLADPHHDCRPFPST